MRALLLVLVLSALWGCGSEVYDTALGPVPLPSPIRTAEALQGPLPFLLVRVSYQDTPNPFTDDQMLALSTMLSSFLTRNSSGQVFVQTQVRDVVLPGTAESYRAASTQAILDQGGPIFPVQVDSLAAVPDLRMEFYRLFLLPATGPVVYVGYGTTRHEPRFAWVSALTFSPEDLFSLPIPHEVGHMLGLQHAESGPMLPRLTGNEATWNELFTDTQRRQLGWI